MAPKGAVCCWQTGQSNRQIRTECGLADHVLKENFENTTRLLVDQARDSLDTATASKTTDGWLGDVLDVITKDLSMTLGASFS